MMRTRGRRALATAIRTLWRLPGSFQAARLFGSSYGLRCVVLHDIAHSESPFTRGMGVTATPEDLEALLRFLTRYYRPVSLQEVLADPVGTQSGRRAALITFDDGYSSVGRYAAPLCRRYGVPATLFLNAAYLDNTTLSPDNLVCYVANVLGMKPIREAARAVNGNAPLDAMADVFSRLFPALSSGERQRFLGALAQAAGLDPAALARQARLYLTRAEVRELAASGFTIGNHTYSHVHCRTLPADEWAAEIDRNQAELATLTPGRVRSFSVPYGSAKDLPSGLATHLERSGQNALFLSQSVANPAGGAGRGRYDRVSVRGAREDELFGELEVLPRLRAARNRWDRFSAARRPRPAKKRIGL